MSSNRRRAYLKKSGNEIHRLKNRISHLETSLRLADALIEHYKALVASMTKEGEGE